MSMPSPKRVALITGAASCIGRAIALRLANDGFELALCDLCQQKDALDSLGREIAHAHPDKHVSRVLADVSIEMEVEAMMECVIEDHGGLDVMVANAGILIIKPMLETSVEEWDQLFAVNTRGIFLCYKYAGLQMIKQGRGGRIIGASSVVGKQAAPNMSGYSATMFAVRGLTQTAAAELGPHGITVNAYAPGTINTPFHTSIQDFPQDYSHPFVLLASHLPGDVLEKDKRMTALNQIGKPEDIAGLVSYLASPESRFMTGQSVSINGGRFFD